MKSANEQHNHIQGTPLLGVQTRDTQHMANHAALGAWPTRPRQSHSLATDPGKTIRPPVWNGKPLSLSPSRPPTTLHTSTYLHCKH